MATAYPEIFAALAADFDHEMGEVKWRKQGPGNVPYISARTVANRLDDVLGPCNWWDDYLPAKDSVLCKLTIRLPDGREITKQDAGGFNPSMPDEGDGIKAGYSDGFKRAAAKFGVGRLLYGDGVPAFVRQSPPAPGAARVEAPSTPEATKPSRTVDDRTFWQLASDAAGKTNDQYREQLSDPDAMNIVDALELCDYVLGKAADEGFGDVPTITEDTKKEEIAHYAEELYGNHRTWVRSTLKAFLSDHLSGHLAKAREGKAVAS